MGWNEVILHLLALKAEQHSLILTKYFLTHANSHLRQLNISFGIQLLAGRLQWMVGSALISGCVLSIAGRINGSIRRRDYVVSILAVASNIDLSSSGCLCAQGVIGFSVILVS